MVLVKPKWKGSLVNLKLRMWGLWRVDFILKSPVVSPGIHIFISSPPTSWLRHVQHSSHNSLRVLVLMGPGSLVSTCMSFQGHLYFIFYILLEQNIGFSNFYKKLNPTEDIYHDFYRSIKDWGYGGKDSDCRAFKSLFALASSSSFTLYLLQMWTLNTRPTQTWLPPGGMV